MRANVLAKLIDGLFTTRGITRVACATVVTASLLLMMATAVRQTTESGVIRVDHQASVVRAAPGDRGAAITIAFDDALATSGRLGRSVLDKYGIPAVLYVPTGKIGQQGYLSWPEVSEIRDHGWEIGAHGRHHLHLEQVSDAEVHSEVVGSLNDLRARGIDVKSYAPAFGAYDIRSLDLITEHYASMRHFHETNVNTEPYRRLRLAVHQVDRTTPLSQLKTWADEALANQTWAIFVFHGVGATPTAEGGKYVVPVQTLEGLASHVVERRIPVSLISERIGDRDHKHHSPQLRLPTSADSGWLLEDRYRFKAGSAPVIRPDWELPLAVGPGARRTRLLSPPVAIASGSTAHIELVGRLPRDLAHESIAVLVQEQESSGSWGAGRAIGSLSGWVDRDVALRYVPSSKQVVAVRVELSIPAFQHGEVRIDRLDLRPELPQRN